MIEIKNKKAYYDYFIEEEIEAGIVLKGTEIKSIREGSANLKDCYAIIRNNEVFLLNMYIAKYNDGGVFNHDERRTRRLLLHKKEIRKLKEMKEQDGISIIPLKIFFSKNYAKLLIGDCKGKKLYDKREVEKNKSINREIDSHLKMKNQY